MAFEAAKNSFEGGLNTDMNPSNVDPRQYIDATNLTLVADGKFLALQSIAGTTSVKNIVNGVTDNEIMGVFASKYTIGASTNLDCLTIFTAKAGGNINIYCYDIAGNNLYTLYTAATPSDYFTSGDRMVDGISYPEKGLDILYFTDNYYEPRKIRCNIQAPYIGVNLPFLTDTTMAVARRQAVGDIQFVSTSSGGTLLTGTYQLAYQLINTTTNQYTRFSLLTTPIHVYKLNNTGIEQFAYAGVGMSSDLKITINILPTADELANYTHFRLAIVENVLPEDAPNLTASVTEIQPISSYLSGSTIANYQIRNNYQNYSTTIDEVVIDTAAISHVKTLSIKNNRLFLGNLSYSSNLYNNGTPSITGGSIILSSTSNPLLNNSFGDPDFATKNKGHFRGEMYRYAISYFDKYGNYSSPSVLDLSLLGENVGQEVSNAFTNPDFATSLAGWSQSGVDTPWVFGAGNAQFSGVNGASSQTLYQTVNPVIGGNYIFSGVVDSGALSGSNTLTLRYMSGASVVGGVTLSVDTTSGFFWQPVTVPAGLGIDGVGIRWVHAGLGAFTFNIFSLSWTKTSVDMKFPRREQRLNPGSTTGITYTLFDGTGNTQSLGLQLNGIDHHPTWAAGFVILRVPRKKDVLFQTPIVPMCNVYGIGPVDNYPTIAREGTTPANVIYTSGTNATGAVGIQGTPMGPNNVLYPMCLAWPKKRSIIKVEEDVTVAGPGNKIARAGEARLVNDPNLQNAQIFPPGNIYTKNHPYSWSSSHAIDTVDSALMKSLYDGSFNSLSSGATSWSPGSGTTSTSFNFNALIDGRYYYDSAHTGLKPALRSSTNIISAFVPFDNGSPGTVINGKFVFTLDKLQTGGVNFGFKPNVQKSGVIELQNSVTSIDDTSALVYASGSSTAKVTEPFTDFVGNNVNANSLEIANVITGQGDNRYGSINTIYNYIYTGTKVVFSTGELVTVAAGGSLPKNVSVWGGDCFVSGFNFKVTDSTYSVVNQEKFVTALTGQTDTQIVAKWGRAWLNLGTGTPPIAMPVALTNMAQYITVVLESEYNGAAVDFDTAGLRTTNASGFNSCIAKTEPVCRSPLVYGYNYGLNKANDQRVFTTQDPLVPILTTLKARFAYSNTKVYNTATDGFDTIPVLNYFDLPETYGKLTKLAIAENNLYSVQDSAIAYLPIDAREIETQGAEATLGVRSGDIVVNTPVWIDIKRGSQHMRSVKETGDKIFMADNANKAFYSLQGKDLVKIYEKGLITASRNIFAAPIPETYLNTIYDISRNEVWFASKKAGVDDGTFCYVWNDTLQLWTSRYLFPFRTAVGNSLGGGVTVANKLYVVGMDVGTSTNIYTMYTNARTTLLGVSSLPCTVSYLVNPMPEYAKTFDDLLFNATRPADASSGLSKVSVYVPGLLGLSVGSGQAFQSALNMNLSGLNTRGEGNYRIKVLRNGDATAGAVGSRLRGLYANVVLDLGSQGFATNPQTVTSALMQWRPSFKAF